MSKLSLTKIGFYNPRRLNDEEIEVSFIARKALFELIFEKISKHSQKLIPQHQIIIGQRGMGKTLLLYRLGAELRKAPHNKNFIPLNYPEEQYNIDRLSKFWQNSLTALVDALDKENKTELADQLENELEKLNADTLSNASDMYQHFQNWINKIKRCPVLLVDNLNLIFNNISTEDQHKLRANLMTKGAPILIGASAVVIQDTIDYGAPFYDAFQIQYLKKISLEESIDILQNLSRLTDKENKIAGIFTKYKGRIATIHLLTGGTPRTLSMLFPLIKDGFQDDIQNDLFAIMDMVTPLYKARFEELSTQMQIVLDAIALNWDPASIEQLRKTTQLTNAQLSPQLKRLVDVGWIAKLKSNISKGDLYEISERFFNVWYLMRRSNRRQQKELHNLSKFLEMFYGEHIIQYAAFRLEKPLENEEGAFINLAIADIIKDEKLSKELSDKSYDKLIEEAKKDSTVLLKYCIPEERILNEIRKLYKALLNDYKNCNTDKALQKVEESLSLAKDEEISYRILNELLLYVEYLMNNQKVKDCKAIIDKVIELSESLKEYTNQDIIDDILSRSGTLYLLLNQFNDAIKTLKKVELQINKNSDYWRYIGSSYEGIRNFNEAEKSFHKSIDLNPKQEFARLRLGRIYFLELSRFEEAAKQFEQLVKLNLNKEKLLAVWNWLGEIYLDKLLQMDKAKLVFEKILQLDKNNVYALFGLGQVFRFESKYQDAESAFKKVIKLEPNNKVALSRLLYLYQFNLNQPKEAIKAYQKCIELEKGNSNKKLISYFYYNMFLLYGIVNNFEEAKNQLNQIKKPNQNKFLHCLCLAVISYKEENAGIARKYIKNAKSELNNELDYYQLTMAGVVIKNLNFGEHYVEVLKETGLDKIWKPYYVAMKALLAKEPKLYLNTIAKEVRKPAAEILDWMQKFEAASK